MTPKSLKFHAFNGPPTKIRVDGPDGNQYDMSVAVAVLDVQDSGDKMPSPHGMIPKMEVKMQLVLSTEPVVLTKPVG